MEKQWFSYGRFADVYDLLMRDIDYNAWAKYLNSFLAEHNIRTILDCACGTGALTLRLASAGYSVTGLDISPDMLRVAAENARNAGLNIPFINRDMRDIRLHKPVDAVICACDGVNYLTRDSDLKSFLSSVYASLNTNGILLFDTSSMYKFMSVLDGNTFGESDKQCAYIWKNSYDNKSALCEMELTCFVKQGMLYERFDERHVQRAYTVERITEILNGLNFTDIQAYEAFTEEAPSAKCERVQYFAVKAGER